MAQPIAGDGLGSLAAQPAMLEDSRRHGDIKQAPEKIIFKGKFTVPQRSKEWIDRPTQEHVLEFIPERHRPIFRFMCLSGVRPSEARALQKRDIYKDHGYINTFAPVRGGEAVKEAKQKGNGSYRIMTNWTIFSGPPLQRFPSLCF